ncbi:PX domain-containing protein EREL1-like [Impatiens glandulifera]|uniref:PX domain-containing protein EREL1-like n=1 Tax=Impatiens glandulifera TaxID=253017 RepID=UPI001FB19D7A|nr:PX domain-containing protein EREL1-like [Impatiens glandulifera]
MNLYGIDPSAYDFSFSDRILIRSLTGASPCSEPFNTNDYGDDGLPLASQKNPVVLPLNRHDGTSPLPFGMDWSPPPRNWEGRDTVWPIDDTTGWSYCVTVPSWIILPVENGSDPVVFYRVEIGVRSSEGVTTTRGVLHRFSDFLKLFSELKSSFPKKTLPTTPAKTLLRNKSRVVLEERRCSLEDWMQKLLMDIDLSRSAPVAIFLELEAAAICSFYDSNENTPDAGDIVSPHQFQSTSNISLISSNLSTTSGFGDESAYYEASDLGTPRNENANHSELVIDSAPPDERNANKSNTIHDDVMYEPQKHLQNEVMEKSVGDNSHDNLQNTEIPTAKDLTKKVKDLEEELEAVKKISKESLEQAIIAEQERYAQVQWEVEDLRSKYAEMELNLKYERDEKIRIELAKSSISEENVLLLQQLDATRKQIESLQKDNEELLELKSKADKTEVEKTG